MSEKELMAQLESIAGEAKSLEGALTAMERLLSSEIGSAVLTLRPEGTNLLSLPEATPGVLKFLESHEFPIRGMYSARIELGGLSAGTLLACFGTWSAPNRLLRAATTQAANLIDALLRRGMALPTTRPAAA